MLKVIHFQRQPAPGQVSIERVFAEIRSAMPDYIQCEVHRSPCLSRGIVPRLANLVDAAKCFGQVNHIVGDVHYLALGVPGARTLLTIHDCISLERLHGLKQTIFRWIWNVLPVRRAGLVSVVSESAERELLRQIRCNPSKIRVIHNCIGSEFVPSMRPFNKRHRLVLQVGTGPNKNLTRVATALSGIHCTLKIIGALTPEQGRWLQEQAIHFVNVPRANSTELLEAYHQADVVIFASTYEGFGLPILEANATGRPVITSQILSMPEVAGSAACFVDPHEIRSIRNGVLRVLADGEYRRRLIAAGFENVKRFAPALIASRYAAMAAGRRPGR